MLRLSVLSVELAFCPPRSPAHLHATVFTDYARLYRTGDFARVHKGTLVFEGRTDSQVKVRGHRVDLSELEAALGRVDGVDKGVVLCHRPGEEDQVSRATAR